MAENHAETPRGDAAGFVKYFKQDFLSGLLVFLIALPLCLGISLASGYPPLAGIFTAIIGAVVTTFISNSELTIKGPAAGLIVIAIGCIEDFGGNGVVGGFTNADMNAYQAALAVGVAAAALQIVFALFRAGIIGEFFPVSTVHGMLAAIGVIIIAKQIPVTLGVEAAGEPLEMLAEIPRYIAEANPAIAAIGLVSLGIMFTWPVLRRKAALLRVIPAPLVVVLVAVSMGLGFDLLHPHAYVLQDHKYQLGEQYLVSMPEQMFGMFHEIILPNFGALAEPKAWKWALMFFIIGTLESVLSAKAIDIIDPWKRKSSMDRDMLAVGTANLCSALVGGLPMISEIVRSKANIDNGAQTRFANFWHGIFLLVCVALIPAVLHLIPLAALAAMLVYTGFRLAHPTEFIHVYRIGREQLLVFVTTLVAVLATDLLIGIAIGIAVKLAIHVINGAPARSLFKPYLEIEQKENETCLIRAHESAVFSNWIPFRRQIESLGLIQRQNVILDLSGTKLVDHSVMDKLHAMQHDFEQQGLRLEITGLETHVPLAAHERSAQKRGLARLRRITVVASETLETRLGEEFIHLGATGYTVTSCRGAGQRDAAGEISADDAQVRIETIVFPDVCDEIVAFLAREIFPDDNVITTVETVEVIRPDRFLRPLPSHGRMPTSRQAVTVGSETDVE